MYSYSVNSPYYIKKEDVKDFYKFQHIKIGIVLIALAIVIGFIHFFVSPKVINMYSDLKLVLPATTQIAYRVLPLVAFLLFGSGLFYMFSKPNNKHLQSDLKKYKAGEMINVRKLSNNKTELYILFFIGIVVALMIIVNVVPIFNLTNSI